MGARWEGIDELEAALDATVVRIDAATKSATKKALDQVARQEKVLLSLGWHPPGTPTGSTPGTPPWRISGHLRDEVSVDGPHPAGRHGWTGQVGSKATYARIHELGGWTGRGHQTKLPARPHLKPAWKIVRPTIRRMYIRAWSDALR